MQNNFSGKCALVTGSTSGIGFGIAKELARGGCDLIIHGIEPEEKIKAIAQELQEEFKVKALAVSADLKNPEAIEKLVTTARANFSRLDILVNNAGIQFVAPIETFPLEKWRELLELHLTVPFLLTQALLPGMRERGWGRIVNIASVHGLVASAHKSGYVSAKHGVLGLTKVVALETAGSGITCNAICPGWVQTPLVEAQIQERATQKGVSFEEETRALIGEKQPLKSFVQTHQLGALTAFLCSDAGSLMTGSSLTMDGGWTAL